MRLGWGCTRRARGLGLRVRRRVGWRIRRQRRDGRRVWRRIGRLRARGFLFTGASGGASAPAHRASVAHRVAAAHRAVAVHRAAPARRAPYRGSDGSWWLVRASGVPLPRRSRSTIKLKAAPRCINFGSVKISGCGRCRSELIMHHEDWTRSHMLCQHTLCNGSAYASPPWSARAG